MLNNRTVLFTALLLLTASCSSDPLQEMEEVRIDDAAATKIVNTPEVSGNTLAVYFDEAAIPTLEQAAKNTATRAARTRSGINDMDEILAGLEIKAFGRIFPETQKHEAATRAAGLHRWYL